MKKVLAIVVVMMLAFIGVANAGANERAKAIGTISDYCVQMLNALCDIYDAGGDDALDEDYTEMLYKYYKLFWSSQQVVAKETQMGVKELTGEVFGVGDSEALWVYVQTQVDEKWLDYVDGDMDRSEYNKWIVEYVRKQVDASESAHERLEQDK